MKKYTKTYNLNNEILIFTYIGEEKSSKNIDEEKINQLLDRCFLNTNYHLNFVSLKEVISWIRTILRDYDETYLSVYAINEELKHATDDCYIYESSAEFINKKLAFYKKNNKVCLDKKNNIFQPFFSNVFKPSDFAYDYETLKKDMPEIAELECINEVKIEKDEIEACEYYKLFYGDYPDFSDPDVNRKLYMIYRFSILFLWGIKEYTQVALHSLMPYGKFESTEVELNLSDEEKNEIRILGEEVRNLSLDQMYRLHDLILTINSNGYFYVKYNYKPQFKQYSLEEKEKTRKLMERVTGIRTA